MNSWWRKLFGNRGERAAARFLRKNGFQILSRQWLTRWGEFDLIAREQETIVFVEVKTRRSARNQHPAEAVDRHKQRRMTQQALVYLKKHRRLESRARFDVIAVTWPEHARTPRIEHIRNAFEPVGDGQFYS